MWFPGRIQGRGVGMKAGWLGPFEQGLDQSLSCEVTSCWSVGVSFVLPWRRCRKPRFGSSADAVGVARPPANPVRSTRREINMFVLFPIVRHTSHFPYLIALECVYECMFQTLHVVCCPQQCAWVTSVIVPRRVSVTSQRKWNRWRYRYSSRS